MSEYAERRDALLTDLIGPGFEGWQQSLVDEFVAECEQQAWLAAWDAEWRGQHEYATWLWWSIRREQRLAAQDALLRRAEEQLEWVAQANCGHERMAEAAATLAAIREMREVQP